MIGTNNVGGDSAEAIAKGVTKIVQTIRAKSPGTKILLLAVFPRGEKAEANSARERSTRSMRLSPVLEDDQHVFYVDLGPKFLQPDGTLPKEIMPDSLHPNDAGVPSISGGCGSRRSSRSADEIGASWCGGASFTPSRAALYFLPCAKSPCSRLPFWQHWLGLGLGRLLVPKRAVTAVNLATPAPGHHNRARGAGDLDHSPASACRIRQIPIPRPKPFTRGGGRTRMRSCNAWRTSRPPKAEHLCFVLQLIQRRGLRQDQRQGPAQALHQRDAHRRGVRRCRDGLPRPRAGPNRARGNSCRKLQCGLGRIPIAFL